MNEEINIELDETLAEGTYVNFTIIAHSPSEFVFDFIKLIPGTDKGRVKGRIILTPEQAKRLMISLTDNINRYESMFGEIRVMPMAHEIESMKFGSGGEA